MLFIFNPSIKLEHIKLCLRESGEKLETYENRFRALATGYGEDMFVQFWTISMGPDLLAL